MFCEQCGKEIPDASEFCGYCGAKVGSPAAGASQAVQPPAAGPQAYAPPPPVGTPPAGQPAVPPVDYATQAGPGAPTPRKSPLPWILGILGVLAVVAVVLVLVFVVFTGDTTGPEKVVENLFKAVEKGDAQMLLGTFEPSFREELEDALGENLELLLEEYFFADAPEDLEYDIRKMETEIDEDTATVKIVEGTMTYTDEDGEKVTEEASESGMDAFQLVRVDGKWYLSGDYLRDMGLDPDELADLDFDEYDELEDEDADDEDTDGEDYDEADEMAEVEAAMLDYAEENSAEGLEFEIFNIFIKGDAAVGVAICTNMELEAPFIIMEKGADGWEGVDFGTGWDPPAWYEAKMAEVEEAMIAFVKENAVEGLEFMITNLLIKGDEAVGVAICTNQEVDAPLVIMEKGSSGWYGVDVGTGIEPPSWYPIY